MIDEIKRKQLSNLPHTQFLHGGGVNPAPYKITTGRRVSSTKGRVL